jgi:glycosyltransferase involved in cell wall biosynthesis
MKVLIASTVVPFLEGGGTFIIDWLETMLRRHGHEVETLRIPLVSHTPSLLDQMLALRLMDVGTNADRLICIRPPSHLLLHPNKVLWFIHHHRPVYDMWHTPYRDVADTPFGWRLARAIVRADEVAFSEARAIFTNSRVVGDRLRRFNRVESEVVYPPIFEPERFRCDGYGDFILYVSRAAEHKRQHLAIEAMRYTRTPVRLVLAGRADSEAYADRLHALVAQHKLQDRVQLLNEWMTEDAKIDLLADCLATIYIPEDEDSYGYPSLEAHHSLKAVITTTDAGGTGELIVDGDNGLITEPDPEAIAAAMDRLYADRAEARRMGEAGPAAIARLRITWDRVIDRLTA